MQLVQGKSAPNWDSDIEKTSLLINRHNTEHIPYAVKSPLPRCNRRCRGGGGGGEKKEKREEVDNVKGKARKMEMIKGKKKKAKLRKRTIIQIKRIPMKFNFQ